jgi:NTP pyrophosphatase (non-canonical NTP hydrolase)
MVDRLEEVVAALGRFAEDRDWGQFHSPKNLAMAIAGEAGELVAEFQWRQEVESERHALGEQEMLAIQAEAADVAIYLLLLSSRLEFDLIDAVWAKLELNKTRFPIPKAGEPGELE